MKSPGRSSSDNTPHGGRTPVFSQIWRRIRAQGRRASFRAWRVVANMGVVGAVPIPDRKVSFQPIRRDPRCHEPKRCLLIVSPSSVVPACTRPPVAISPTRPIPGLSSTQPLSPAAAAAGFRAPEGFRVNVFAAEPDVRNPVAMAWDTRGRLWVAENYTYSDSTQIFDLRLRDRVLIFEDADGDGRADKRTVFTDEVQRLGSVELGFGGVWLLCPPQLLFVPDRNGDDVPDGPAEVVLDGFTVARENYHTFANGLRWGPDGWLYGRCGASSPGEVGAPGTPDAGRIPLRGGLWRYHPVHKRFEVLCHGTTNPWGHDWNALGEAFFINTVNGHLWHAIPGAHFARPHSIEPNPRAYAIIDQHADHYHWDNSKDFKTALIPGGIADRRGGGHAHSGLMIYLADQWPEPYRDKLFTLNFHGRRVNVERLERSGSGYVGRHEPDIFFAADPWFRGIDLSYGPDGSVFVLDWSDTGECHEHDGVHRSSGRIYRFTYGEPARLDIRDVSKLGERDLVALHRHPNEWFVRKARRVLAERSTRGEPLVEAKAGLRTLFDHDPDPSRKIRALCSLFVIGGTDVPFLRGLLRHEHESVRTWAIRLLTDRLPIDTIYSKTGRAGRRVARRLAARIRRRSPGMIPRPGAAGACLDAATVAGRPARGAGGGPCFAVRRQQPTTISRH